MYQRIVGLEKGELVELLSREIICQVMDEKCNEVAGMNNISDIKSDK